jgi:hypothetical protein
VTWSRQPAMYAWQAALLEKRVYQAELSEQRDASTKPLERALRETLMFWARYDGIDLPPLLRRADVEAFELEFLHHLRRHPLSPAGANAAALGAVREVAWARGWVPF